MKKKKRKNLKRRVADLEKQFQNQPMHKIEIDNVEWKQNVKKLMNKKGKSAF